MKRVFISPSMGLLIIYRCMVALLLALVVVLISGSLYALIRPADSGPLFRIGGGEGEGAAAPEDGEVGIFTGVGRLRIPIAGEQESAAVIVSISFPYPAEDRPFSEELASRTGDFRSIATEYFASLSPDNLARFDEGAAKQEILNRYNALLMLGKINALFFSDLMILE